MPLFDGNVVHGDGRAEFTRTANAAGSAYTRNAAPTQVSEVVNSDLVKLYRRYALRCGRVAQVMETDRRVSTPQGSKGVDRGRA